MVDLLGSWCRGCGRYHSPGKHDPTFTVWHPDRGEEGPEGGRTFAAHDHEAAAEKWGERDDTDSADYTIISGSPALIHVVGPDGDSKTFRVTAEAVPTYSAEEVHKDMSLARWKCKCGRWHEADISLVGCCSDRRRNHRCETCEAEICCCSDATAEEITP